jgi:hypothetical protein
MDESFSSSFIAASMPDDEEIQHLVLQTDIIIYLILVDSFNNIHKDSGSTVAWFSSRVSDTELL